MTSAHLFLGIVVGVVALLLTGPKGRLSLSLLVLITFAPCVVFAQSGPADLSVLSAASYQKTVSPNSLAVVFGTNLATSSLSAQLDASGLYPTFLGGTTVAVNGELARLLYVSPTQIDLLIPPDIKPGNATVVVTPSGETAVSGSATVALAAPALFSADGTGQGPGSVLNAVTFTTGPFFVNTAQNSGSDKRTRLAIFGTGFRYAGNTNMDPTLTNVGKNVAVQVVDGTGTAWPLTVEYAGAAPIYAGLDQINAVLPPDLDGSGTVGLTVSVGATTSNVVTLIIASSVPPSISSLSTSSAPPGTKIQISGSGFAPNIGSQIRSHVLLELPDGTTSFMPALIVSPSQVVTMLIPIPLGAKGDWYSGPAKMCVQIDGQTSCAADSIQIAPRLVSSQPPGQVTLANIQQLQNSIGSLTLPGSSALSTFVQQQNQTNLSHLSDLITQAASASPPLLQVHQPDGSTATVPFSLDFVRAVDSLLLAALASPNQVPSSGHVSPALISLSSGCGSSAETNLQAMASQYNSIMSLQDNLVWVFIGALVTEAVAACVAGGPTCLASASAAVTATLPTAVDAYTAASWGLFASQIGIEASNAFLNSITAQVGGGGTSTTLEVNGSDTLAVSGNFGPKYPPAAFSQEFAMALSEVLGRELASISICGPEGTPTRAACDWLFGEVADEVKKLTVNYPTPPTIPQGPNQVALSSSSISATPSSTPEVSLSLPCGGPGQVLGNAPTSAGGESFALAANLGNLLSYGVSTPSTAVTVIVNQPARLQSLTLVPSSAIGGNSVTGTVTLTRGAPKSGFPVQLTSSSIDAPLPTPSFVIPAGQLQQTFSVSTRPVSSAENVTISASSAGQSVSATLSILPSPSTISLVLSSGSVNGGDTVTGTVSFTPALAVSAIVTLSSNNATAQVPTSIQVPAGGVGTFVISTTTVSSPQMATITATYGSSRSSATLQISTGPTVALSGIQLDKSTVTGGDTVFGTVILTSPAPTGGTTVTLQSSDSSIALVQASTVVPAGRASATFSISTYAVASVRSVLISGTAGGATKSTSLTINPSGVVTLSGFTIVPNPLYGGSAARGTLILSDLAPSGGATVTIQSGDSSLVQVPFTVTIPQAADSYEFVITTTPVDGSQTVVVTATYKSTSVSVVITLLPVDKVIKSSPPKSQRQNGAVTRLPEARRGQVVH